MLNKSALQLPGIDDKGQHYEGFGGGQLSNSAIAASALRLAAKDLSMTLSDEQIKMLLGHAAFESGFGMDGAKNSLRNTNNWGAIQATKSFVKAHYGEPGYGAVAHQDSDPIKGKFIGWYAVNPTAKAGAKQFLSQVRNQIRSASSIGDYATRLYQAGYYGGVHGKTKNDVREAGKRTPPFLPAEQSNINDYANAIRRAMPAMLPEDTAESIKAAQSIKIGPFAPLEKRLTAAEGIKHPTMQDAENAWNKSRSNPQAYGLKPIPDFSALANADGIALTGGSTINGPAQKKDNTSMIGEIAHTGYGWVDTLLSYIVKELETYADDTACSIIITADDMPTQYEYARALCTILNNELKINTTITSNNIDINIYCNGDMNSYHFKKLLTNMPKIFKQASGMTVINSLKPVLKDKAYKEIDWNTALQNYNQFRLKIYGIHGTR